MSDAMTIRTRFAPSPSGHLHVGGARTALFCWAYARKRGGKFILRIEDTDQKRSSESASLGFLEDLKWLGITWDEGPVHQSCGGGDASPYFQSQRLAIYDMHVDQLIAAGKAYRAFETAEELDAARRAAREANKAWRYDRAALRLDQATIDRYLKENRPHVVRLRLPDGRESVTIHDEVRGDVTVAMTELDDFVIRKADGYPTYHFAVVVDDELMGVTHVIRAQEHLNNTHRHVLLQEALGFRSPVYAHVSVITNPDGSKMSKRDKDKALRAAVKEQKRGEPPRASSGLPVIPAETWTWWLSSKDHQLELEHGEALAGALGIDLPEINVDDFRRAGYLPEVLLNYLSLLGWSPGGDIEKFDMGFFIDRFDFDRVVKTPAKFDREKLMAFNNDAIRELSDEEFAARFRTHCEEFHPEFIERLSPEQFHVLALANKPRSRTLEDPIRSSRFFIMRDDQIVIEDNKAVREALVKGEPSGYAHLEMLLPILRALPEWSLESIAQAIKSYVDVHAEGKLNKVAQPLRVAVSGTTVSPAIYETLAILGRDSTINRIERCLAHRQQFAPL
jgi:glutamyl-tRNA synthetase